MCGVAYLSWGVGRARLSCGARVAGAASRAAARGRASCGGGARAAARGGGGARGRAAGRAPERAGGMAPLGDAQFPGSDLIDSFSIS